MPGYFVATGAAGWEAAPARFCLTPAAASSSSVSAYKAARLLGGHLLGGPPLRARISLKGSQCILGKPKGKRHLVLLSKTLEQNEVGVQNLAVESPDFLRNLSPVVRAVRQDVQQNIGA